MLGTRAYRLIGKPTVSKTVTAGSSPAGPATKAMNPFIFQHGKIIRQDKAKVSPLDIGLLRGYAVYDGMTMTVGKVVCFRDHYNRFKTSAKTIGLAFPYSTSYLEQICTQLYQKNKYKRMNIRAILSGGETRAGILPTGPELTLLSEEWVALPKAVYQKGAKLITHEYKRFMPSIKTTHYTIAVMLQKERIRAKAIEILYTDHGRALECSTSNIFMVKGDTLITPTADILHGITRKIVLGLDHGLRVEEREVSVAELLAADEVFITSSFKDVVPVVTIDDKKIGGGEVGRETKKIIDLFKVFLEKH